MAFTRCVKILYFIYRPQFATARAVKDNAQMPCATQVSSAHSAYLRPGKVCWPQQSACIICCSRGKDLAPKIWELSPSLTQRCGFQECRGLLCFSWGPELERDGEGGAGCGRLSSCWPCWETWASSSSPHQLETLSQEKLSAVSKPEGLKVFGFNTFRACVDGWLYRRA